MTFTNFAPEGTPSALVADLRKGYHKAKTDKEYLASTTKQFTVPFSFVELEEGLKIIQSVSRIELDVRRLSSSYGKSGKKKRKKKR